MIGDKTAAPISRGLLFLFAQQFATINPMSYNLNTTE